MSSNNQLIIIRKKNEFEIHENPCFDNEFKKSRSTLIQKEKTLVKAIKFANKFCAGNMVEYGVAIDDSCLKDEKKSRWGRGYALR